MKFLLYITFHARYNFLLSLTVKGELFTTRSNFRTYYQFIQVHVITQSKIIDSGYHLPSGLHDSTTVRIYTVLLPASSVYPCPLAVHTMSTNKALRDTYIPSGCNELWQISGRRSAMTVETNHYEMLPILSCILNSIFSSSFRLVFHV